MKRLISLIITSIVLWWVIAYSGFLLSYWAIHTTIQFTQYALLFTIALMVLVSIALYYATIGFSYASKPKTILSVLALVIIMFWWYVFIDPIESNTFLSDYTRLAGAYLLIATLMWFIGTSDDTNDSPVIQYWKNTRVKNAEIIEI